VWVPAAQPLPPDLLSRPFTVAEALARGVTRKVLRGQRFRVPFRGVRVCRDLPDDLATLCRSALLLLPPDASFSHLTAAQLHGLPGSGRLMWRPLHVTSAHRAAREQPGSDLG
jgi:hypothetical protein